MAERYADVSVGNSTIAALSGGAVFTGVYEECWDFSNITVAVYTDADSAPLGLSIEFSTDGTNWDHKFQHNIKSGVPQTRSAPVVAKYFRVVYTNGSSAQTFLRLQTRLHAHQTSPVAGGAAQTVTFGDSSLGDAFGRLRTSNPETLFDSKQLFDNQPLFWDDQEVSGSGTGSSHSTATASTTITVGATTAGKRVRQTFQRFNYQPGKSQLILMTGTVSSSGGGTGITRAMGYFDDNNGVYFQDDEGAVKACIRTSTSGSPVDTKVAQADWNIDPLDGTGPSGLTLDATKSQIGIWDLEWLGVGRVRVGFAINGQFVYCHEFNHSNVSTGVYMSTPNLPLRYEIENDGAGAASGLECICSTVMSEGGTQTIGILRHADSGALSSLASGTNYAMLGIRLKSTHLGATINIESLSAIATTPNDAAHWELILNPTVAGTFTYADETNSAVQIARGALTNTVTGGTKLTGGFFSTALPPTLTIPNARRLGSTISGTPDTIVLVVTPITNNITVDTALTWRELL